MNRFRWTPLIRTRLFRITRYFELPYVGFLNSRYFQQFFIFLQSLKKRGSSVFQFYSRTHHTERSLWLWDVKRGQAPFVCTHRTHFVGSGQCASLCTPSSYVVVPGKRARAVYKMRHWKLRSFCPCFMTLEFKQVEFHAACCGDKILAPQQNFSPKRAWYTRKRAATTFPFPHVLSTLSVRGLSDFFASKPSLVSDWLSREKANI